MALYEQGINIDEIKKYAPAILIVVVFIAFALLFVTFAMPKQITLQLNPQSLKIGKGSSTLKVTITNTFEEQLVATLKVYAADETSLRINPKDNPVVKLAKGETREFYYEIIPSATILPGKYLITAELQLGEKTFVGNIYLNIEK